MWQVRETISPFMSLSVPLSKALNLHLLSAEWEKVEGCGCCVKFPEEDVCLNVMQSL